MPENNLRAVFGPQTLMSQTTPNPNPNPNPWPNTCPNSPQNQPRTVQPTRLHDPTPMPRKQSVPISEIIVYQNKNYQNNSDVLSHSNYSDIRYIHNSNYNTGVPLCPPTPRCAPMALGGGPRGTAGVNVGYRIWGSDGPGSSPASQGCPPSEGSRVCLGMGPPRSALHHLQGAPCCARAVQKAGHFRPIFPDGQGDRGNYCVPIHRTAQIQKLRQ